MNSLQIIQHRLHQQQLLHSRFTRPADLVRWMGCIQAQDYAGAKWAIGNRIKGSTDASIEKDFNEGKILRTHVLRPTWHFVAPEDIRWMLQLTAPKIKAFNKRLHVKLGISDKDLKRSSAIITKALSDHTYLPRTALLPLLAKAKINTDDIRLGFLLMDAELDGLICSGPRQGKQFTYALLADRVPATAAPGREEAIARLTLCYFSSRGPATIQDFQWWSGLNISDIKTGLQLNKAQLTHTVVNGQAYWFTGGTPLTKRTTPSTLLLPWYDEYAVAYKDRSDILPAEHQSTAGYGIFKPVVVINGKIGGIWNRKEGNRHIALTTQLVSPGKKTAVDTAAAAYAAFMGKELQSVTAI
ncbi:winged helix DNA-binding domain-containing protein [Chitinophaga sp. ARDCPP14]|uniref:winged helix DNA-binding domain-containing protein n=1 Tax=Chitinophaga sp. ARDCPP14 TaxID=3391139 RepID=UPI003F52443D